ncbi:hypothetical protein BC629DRAFT_808518 [Irpex lacteus]|nr:hypothetical protein BC629DRAFT_808518 [Irpex lacteus]
MECPVRKVNIDDLHLLSDVSSTIPYNNETDYAVSPIARPQPNRPLTSRPSPIFTRLSDALFFWIDSQCTVPGLRGTGVIEPEKYAWMSMRAGAGELEGRLLVEYIESLYEAAGFPVQWRVRGDGRTIAVLDRRAFLHSQVFDARADPDETWKFWQKSLPLFHLTDPLSHTQFPTPLPRSAFPSTPTPSCLSIYKSWQESIVADVQRKEVERRARESVEEMQRITGTYTSVVGVPTAESDADSGGFGGCWSWRGWGGWRNVQLRSSD